MVDDLKDTIEQNAQGPRQAGVDGVSVQHHSLPDQIAADKYLAAKKAAATNPVKAFTRVKIVPPGTVGDYARLAYLAELTEAVNRRFNVLYAPDADYSAHLLGGYVMPQIYAGPLLPLPHLRLAVTEKLIAHDLDGCLGGSPASPSSMKWLWPEAGADYGKEISYAVTPPEGKVSIWSYLGSEVPGGGGVHRPLPDGRAEVHPRQARQRAEAGAGVAPLRPVGDALLHGCGHALLVARYAVVG